MGTLVETHLIAKSKKKSKSTKTQKYTPEPVEELETQHPLAIEQYIINYSGQLIGQYGNEFQTTNQQPQPDVRHTQQTEINSHSTQQPKSKSPPPKNPQNKRQQIPKPPKNAFQPDGHPQNTEKTSQQPKNASQPDGHPQNTEKTSQQPKNASQPASQPQNKQKTSQQPKNASQPASQPQNKQKTSPQPKNEQGTTQHPETKQQKHRRAQNKGGKNRDETTKVIGIYGVRYYGHFRCKMCRKVWTSSQVYATETEGFYTQRCKTCYGKRSWVEPYVVDPIRCPNCGEYVAQEGLDLDQAQLCDCPGRKKGGKDKPHRQDLCSRCKDEEMPCGSF